MLEKLAALNINSETVAALPLVPSRRKARHSASVTRLAVLDGVLSFQGQQDPEKTGMSEALPIPARTPPLPRAQRHGQRLPAGDGPGTGAGLRGVGDGWEQPAQLDRGRELAALLVDGADRGGLSLGDDEHAGRMGVRTEGGKRPVPRGVGGAGEAGRPAGGGTGSVAGRRGE